MNRIQERGVVEEAIHKADILIEAMPYIRAFRDKLVVIKLGGSALASVVELHKLLEKLGKEETFLKEEVCFLQDHTFQLEKFHYQSKYCLHL